MDPFFFNLFAHFKAELSSDQLTRWLKYFFKAEIPFVKPTFFHEVPQVR